MTATDPGTPTVAGALRGVVAVLSLGAGVLHASVVNEHFDQHTLFGWFFIGASLYQGTWAALVLNRPSRRLSAVGAAGNAAIVVLWAASRTVGLPIGPRAGSPEAPGFPDVLATVFELLIVAGVVALLRGNAGAARSRAASVAAGAVWVVVAALTAAVILASGEAAHGLR